MNDNGMIRHRFLRVDRPFRIGDRVMLSTNSEYYGLSDTNPKDIGGIITRMVHGSLTIRVNWDNDETNAYDKTDLRYE